MKTTPPTDEDMKRFFEGFEKIKHTEPEDELAKSLEAIKAANIRLQMKRK